MVFELWEWINDITDFGCNLLSMQYLGYRNHHSTMWLMHFPNNMHMIRSSLCVVSVWHILRLWHQKQAYLKQGNVIASHGKLWGVITYPWPPSGTKVLIYNMDFTYPPDLSHWHWANHSKASLQMKQPLTIEIKRSIMQTTIELWC